VHHRHHQRAPVAIVVRGARPISASPMCSRACTTSCRRSALLAEPASTAEQCGFIGDDVIDLPMLTRVGFAVSVPNGHPEVRSRVHYVTNAGGGRGAVREVCDFMLLRAQGNYERRWRRSWFAGISHA
jgi:hypothetical protein